MKLNEKGIKLMHKYEGCELEAYLCPARVWTIGWGNTFYEDGTKVKKGDKISQERADELFKNIVNSYFVDKIKKYIKKDLNDNQFSALVSFSYNVGVGNFKSSTLLRVINKYPNDTEIANQFLRWNKAGGKKLKGLTKRRIDEAKLYFS